jgi:tape measure domain-containing protein
MQVVLGANVAEFQKNFSIAEKQLKGFARAGESMQGVGENLSKWISAPLAGLAAISLKTAGDIQALQKGLTAVSGSAEASEKQFASLKEVAKLPGLGLEEAVQGSINLQAAGFNAKQAEGALKGFGNALATVGKGKAELDGVITALSQMAAKGKISAEEINQIAERVPQIRKVMQQAFGTSNTEELQKMGITATEFVDKVTVELNKLPPVAGGLKNSFENLGDSGKLALANLGDAINKNLNVEGFFNSLAEKLAGLAEGFSQLNPGIQKFLIIGGAIAAAIGPVVLIFGGILAAIPSMVAGYAALKVATIALASSTKKWVVANGMLVIQIAAIAAAVAALALIAKSIYDSWGSISAFFDRLWAGVQYTFASRLLAIIQTVNKFGKFVGVEFKDTEKSLKSFADSAKANLDSKPVVTFGDAVGAVGQSMTDNLKSGMQAVKDLFFSGGKAAESGADTVTTSVDKIKASSKGLTEEQQKALDALVKGWNVASASAKLYGDSYDVIGEKTKLLQSTIQNLLETGLKPQSKIIQQLKRDFDALNSSAGLKNLDVRVGDSFGEDIFAPKEGDGKLEVPAQLKLLPVDPDALKTAIDPAAEALGAFNDKFQEMIRGGLTDSFVLLGQTIGDALTGGTGGMESFFDGFLKIFAGFLGQFGEMLIAAGVAKLALEKLIITPGTAPLAIAAGIALVALSSVASKAFSKGPNFGGGGATPSAPRSASPSYGSPGTSGGYGEGKVSFEISGNNLQGVLSREAYRQKRFWN